MNVTTFALPPSTTERESHKQSHVIFERKAEWHLKKTTQKKSGKKLARLGLNPSSARYETIARPRLCWGSWLCLWPRERPVYRSGIRSRGMLELLGYAAGSLLWYIRACAFLFRNASELEERGGDGRNPGFRTAQARNLADPLHNTINHHSPSNTHGAFYQSRPRLKETAHPSDVVKRVLPVAPLPSTAVKGC